ncbi:MAG: hypothetical protein ACOY4K_13755 [Pseudomonadota bacterium]
MGTDLISHPFHGPRSKLVRARKVLGEFRAHEEVYLSELKFGVYGRRDATGLTHVFVRIETPIPDDLAHTAAEATYHVRSSLDQMLGSIARVRGKNDTSTIHFPFLENESEFDGREARKKMKGLPEDVRDLIFRLHPWEGGDADLWGLGKLANVDKHNALIPFGAMGGAAGLSWMFLNGGGHPDSGIVSEPGNLLEGVDFFRHGPAGGFGMRPEAEIDISAIVSFGRDVPCFALEPAAPTIERLIELGESIVETFATHCFGEWEPQIETFVRRG